MAFKEAVEQMNPVLRWTPEPKKADDKSIFLGPVITGYYIGMKTEVGQNDSNLYEIELTDTQMAGQTVAVWGSALLDGKFGEVPQGSMVRLTCLGIQQPKSPGGRQYMGFKLEYDETTRRPMRAAGSEANAAAPAAPVAPANPAVPQAAPQAPATGDGF